MEFAQRGEVPAKQRSCEHGVGILAKKAAVYRQGFEEGRGVNEVVGNILEVIWCCRHGQIAESACEIGSDLEEGIAREEAQCSL